MKTLNKVALLVIVALTITIQPVFAQGWRDAQTWEQIPWERVPYWWGQFRERVPYWWGQASPVVQQPGLGLSAVEAYDIYQQNQNPSQLNPSQLNPQNQNPPHPCTGAINIESFNSCMMMSGRIVGIRYECTPEGICYGYECTVDGRCPIRASHSYRY